VCTYTSYLCMCVCVYVSVHVHVHAYVYVHSDAYPCGNLRSSQRLSLVYCQVNQEKTKHNLQAPHGSAKWPTQVDHVTPPSSLPTSPRAVSGDDFMSHYKIQGVWTSASAEVVTQVPLHVGVGDEAEEDVEDKFREATRMG